MVIPDSHFFASIDMLIACLTFDTPTKEYLLKGLENTKREGYEVRRVRSPKSKVAQKTRRKQSGKSSATAKRSHNTARDAIALCKEIFAKTKCVDSEACRYEAVIYMKTYDKLESIAQQHP